MVDGLLGEGFEVDVVGTGDLMDAGDDLAQACVVAGGVFDVHPVAVKHLSGLIDVQAAEDGAACGESGLPGSIGVLTRHWAMG